MSKYHVLIVDFDYRLEALTLSKFYHNLGQQK